jgi:hypothetical protein
MIRNIANKILHLCLYLACLMYTNIIYAADTFSANSREGKDLGALAKEVTKGPIYLLDDAMKNIAYATSLILLLASFYKLKRFRANPRETTFSTVVIYFILAIFMFALAFTHNFSKMLSYA